MTLTTTSIMLISTYRYETLLFALLTVNLEDKTNLRALATGSGFYRKWWFEILAATRRRFSGGEDFELRARLCNHRTKLLRDKQIINSYLRSRSFQKTLPRFPLLRIKSLKNERTIQQSRMDWLRCNKCYREMLGASRSFSLTQCGHVYCNLCLGQLGVKCPQCGTVGFQVMNLTKPPKLESTMNHFSPLEDVMEFCCNAANFQENQMAIAARGFQHTEKKYEALKVAISKGMGQIKELKADCQKLREEKKNILRAREAQQRAARSVQAQTNINPTNQQQNRGRYQEQENQRKQESSARPITSYVPSGSGSSVRHRHMPGTLETPAAERRKKTTMMHTPENPYTPNMPYHGAGSTTDSGRSSMAFNSAGRVEGFLVPTIQRVPKSAATANRKTPTSVRISVAKKDT